eukprot:10641840-Ditylum_brightwellii.AAC.1
MQSKTEPGMANITSEMQADDNFCKSHTPTAVCLWKRNSGKKPPIKCRTTSTKKNCYDRLMKGLKNALKPDIFLAKLNAFGHVIKSATDIMKEIISVLRGGSFAS